MARTHATRSAAALVMSEHLDRALFSDVDRARLESAVDLVAVTTDPLTIEPTTAARIEVVVGGWGTPSFTPEVIGHLPALGLFAYAAGTVKSIVTPDLYARGVVVTSAAAANAVPVAEFTFAAIVMCAKQVFRARERHRSSAGTESAMAGLRGVGLYRRTIGIVGASLVGRGVLERIRNLDCAVLLFDPFVSDEDAAELGAEKVELDELCGRSNIVSLHAPLLEETTGMIGPAQLAAMRDGAWLINTARGAIVDTSALTAECVSGRLNAFIDTSHPEPLPPDSPLYTLDNVVLTPHIAGSLGNEIGRLGAHAVDEVERFVRGEPPRYPVTESDLARMA